MRLTKQQLNVISEFFLSLSKGLSLGVFASQNFVINIDYTTRIILTISHTLVALLFLIIAIMYRQDAK